MSKILIDHNPKVGVRGFKKLMGIIYKGFKTYFNFAHKDIISGNLED